MRLHELSDCEIGLPKIIKCRIFQVKNELPCEFMAFVLFDYANAHTLSHFDPRYLKLSSISSGNKILAHVYSKKERNVEENYLHIS